MSRLNMNAMLWKQLIHNVSPLMPYLQAHLGVDASLDKSIRELVEFPHTQLTCDGNVAGLTQLEQTRVTLRFLLSRKRKVRLKGLAIAIWRLTDFKKKLGLPLNYSPQMDDNMADMMVFSPQQMSGFDIKDMSFPNISSSNVEKLWEIFCDDLVGNGELQVSAAEQLAVILQGSLP